MDSTASAYFDALADRLRATGMDTDRVAGTIGELRTHLAEIGGSPEEEFGPVDDFADRLTATRRGATRRRNGSATGTDPAAEPDENVETWTWTADIYLDRTLLDRYGADGWEVDRVDGLGRFVAHRNRREAMAWEYRREIRGRGDDPARTADALAPDGWEPCGRWLHVQYFKRPLAVETGPAATVTAPGDRPGRLFVSRRVRGLLLVAAVCAAVLVALVTADGWAGPSTLLCVLAGACAGGIAAWYGTRRDIRRGVREDSA